MQTYVCPKCRKRCATTGGPHDVVFVAICREDRVAMIPAALFNSQVLVRAATEGVH